MPGRRYGRRNFGMRPVINSMKNVFNATGSLSGTKTGDVLAKAVTSPAPTNASDTSQGCVIKAIWLSFDICGTSASGVANNCDVYLAKNPGNNLTLPDPISVGTSNEKKFMIKQWRAMIMATSDGNTPYHWEGWIKLPKRYHRMGTDDVWTVQLQCTSGSTGLYSLQAIYKWYR